MIAKFTSYRVDDRIYRIFYYLALFRKLLSNRPLVERIPEIDPWLGATVTGAEVLGTGK